MKKLFFLKRVLLTIAILVVATPQAFATEPSRTNRTACFETAEAARNERDEQCSGSQTEEEFQLCFQESYTQYASDWVTCDRRFPKQNKYELYKHILLY